MGEWRKKMTVLRFRAVSSGNQQQIGIEALSTKSSSFAIHCKAVTSLVEFHLETKLSEFMFPPVVMMVSYILASTLDRRILS